MKKQKLLLFLISLMGFLFLTAGSVFAATSPAKYINNEGSPVQIPGEWGTPTPLAAGNLDGTNKWYYANDNTGDGVISRLEGNITVSTGTVNLVIGSAGGMKNPAIILSGSITINDGATLNIYSGGGTSISNTPGDMQACYMTVDALAGSSALTINKGGTLNMYYANCSFNGQNKAGIVAGTGGDGNATLNVTGGQLAGANGSDSSANGLDFTGITTNLTNATVIAGASPDFQKISGSDISSNGCTFIGNDVSDSTLSGGGIENSVFVSVSGESKNVTVDGKATWLPGVYTQYDLGESGSVEVGDGDSLTIPEDLSVTGEGTSKVTVESNGTLTVKGDVDLSDCTAGSSFTVQGTGTLDVAPEGSIDYGNNITPNISGNVTVTITLDTNDLVPGISVNNITSPWVYNNNGTYTQKLTYPGDKTSTKIPLPNDKSGLNITEGYNFIGWTTSNPPTAESDFVPEQIDFTSGKYSSYYLYPYAVKDQWIPGTTQGTESTATISGGKIAEAAPGSTKNPLVINAPITATNSYPINAVIYRKGAVTTPIDGSNLPFTVTATPNEPESGQMQVVVTAESNNIANRNGQYVVYFFLGNPPGTNKLPVNFTPTQPVAGTASINVNVEGWINTDSAGRGGTFTIKDSAGATVTKTSIINGCDPQEFTVSNVNLNQLPAGTTPNIMGFASTSDFTSSTNLDTNSFFAECTPVVASGSGAGTFTFTIKPGTKSYTDPATEYTIFFYTGETAPNPSVANSKPNPSGTPADLSFTVTTEPGTWAKNNEQQNFGINGSSTTSTTGTGTFNKVTQIDNGDDVATPFTIGPGGSSLQQVGDNTQAGTTALPFTINTTTDYTSGSGSLSYTVTPVPKNITAENSGLYQVYFYITNDSEAIPNNPPINSDKSSYTVLNINVTDEKTLGNWIEPDNATYSNQNILINDGTAINSEESSSTINTVTVSGITEPSSLQGQKITAYAVKPDSTEIIPTNELPFTVEAVQTSANSFTANFYLQGNAVDPEDVGEYQVYFYASVGNPGDNVTLTDTAGLTVVNVTVESGQWISVGKNGTNTPNSLAISNGSQPADVRIISDTFSPSIFSGTITPYVTVSGRSSILEKGDYPFEITAEPGNPSGIDVTVTPNEPITQAGNYDVYFYISSEEPSTNPTLAGTNYLAKYTITVSTAQLQGYVAGTPGEINLSEGKITGSYDFTPSSPTSAILENSTKAYFVYNGDKLVYSSTASPSDNQISDLALNFTANTDSDTPGQYTLSATWNGVFTAEESYNVYVYYYQTGGQVPATPATPPSNADYIAVVNLIPEPDVEMSWIAASGSNYTRPTDGTITIDSTTDGTKTVNVTGVNPATLQGFNYITAYLLNGTDSIFSIPKTFSIGDQITPGGSGTSFSFTYTAEELNAATAGTENWKIYFLASEEPLGNYVPLVADATGADPAATPIQVSVTTYGPASSINAYAYGLEDDFGTASMQVDLDLSSYFTSVSNPSSLIDVIPASNDNITEPQLTTSAGSLSSDTQVGITFDVTGEIIDAQAPIIKVTNAAGTVEIANISVYTYLADNIQLGQVPGNADVVGSLGHEYVQYVYGVNTTVTQLNYTQDPDSPEFITLQSTTDPATNNNSNNGTVQYSVNTADPGAKLNGNYSYSLVQHGNNATNIAAVGGVISEVEYIASKTEVTTNPIFVGVSPQNADLLGSNSTINIKPTITLNDPVNNWGTSTNLNASEGEADVVTPGSGITYSKSSGNQIILPLTVNLAADKQTVNIVLSNTEVSEDTVTVPVILFEATNVGLIQGSGEATIDYTTVPGLAFTDTPSLTQNTNYQLTEVGGSSGAVSLNLAISSNQLTLSSLSGAQEDSTIFVETTNNGTSAFSPTVNYQYLSPTAGVSVYGILATINPVTPVDVEVKAPSDTDLENAGIDDPDILGSGTVHHGNDEDGQLMPEDTTQQYGGYQTFFADADDGSTFLFWIVQVGEDITDEGTSENEINTMALVENGTGIYSANPLVFNVTEDTVLKPVFVDTDAVTNVTLQFYLNNAEATQNVGYVVYKNQILTDATGSSTTSSPITVLKNSPFELEAVSGSSYSFISFVPPSGVDYVPQGGEAGEFTVTSTAADPAVINVNFYQTANTNYVPVTIQINEPGTGSVYDVTNKATYINGQRIAVKLTDGQAPLLLVPLSSAGYSFTKWSIEGGVSSTDSLTDDVNNFSITGPATITANFETGVQPQPPTEEDISISPETLFFYYNDGAFDTPSKNFNIAVNSTANIESVTLEPSVPGIISITPNSFDSTSFGSGTTVTAAVSPLVHDTNVVEVTATLNLEDGTTKKAKANVVILANVTPPVEYPSLQFAVASGSGSISVTGAANISNSQGDVITVLSPENSYVLWANTVGNSQLISWEVSGPGAEDALIKGDMGGESGGSPTQTLSISNITDDVIIEANFTRNTQGGGGTGGGPSGPTSYTYRVNTNPSAGGTATVNNGSSATVTSGSNVTFSATPAEGYRFVGWQYNGQTVSTANPYTIQSSATSAGTYTALFSQATPEAPDITFEPDSVDVEAGMSESVKVTITPETTEEVMVESADPDIATASYDPETGEITVTGISAGTTTITVTVGDSTRTFEVTVTGEATAPTAIEITPDPLYLTTVTGGKTTGQLVAEATPANAGLSGLKWSISPTTVANIDPDTGVVSAVAQGQATVTATIGNVTATGTVIVNNNPVICSSIIASGSTPDTFTVTVSGVKANPALDVTGSVNNVSIFTWTGPDQNDMQCVRVLAPVAPGSDTYAYQPFQVNGNEQYYFNADNIYVQAYGSLDTSQGYYLGSGANYSWVNPVTAGTNSVAYITYQENNGFNRPTVFNGTVSGVTGRHLQLEGIRVSSNIEGVEVVSDVHEENVGWVEAVHDGVYAGTQHQHRQLEAIRLRLEGTNASNYDIYYQVHAEDKGWMGPVGATQIAGTVGEHRQIEAIQVQIVPKGTVPAGWATN